MQDPTPPPVSLLHYYALLIHYSCTTGLCMLWTVRNNSLTLTFAERLQDSPYARTLPPPVLWGSAASRRTPRTLSRAPRCTRWRWSPVSPAASWQRSAALAAPRPAPPSGAPRTRPAEPLGTRREGPSWLTGVFTFPADTVRVTERPPVTGLHGCLNEQAASASACQGARANVLFKGLPLVSGKPFV